MTDERNAETLEQRLEDIRARLEILEANLPAVVDPALHSEHSKVPMKALDFRAALVWRFSELARGAYEAYRADRLAVAITLTRGAVESAAALWYMYRKLKAVNEANALGDMDDELMKLLLGGRVDPKMPRSFNVLTFVDAIDKDVEGFREQYDELSEFAHPNFGGTLGLFGNPAKGRRTEFGRGVKAILSAPRHAGTINLRIALMIFEHAYEKITVQMPAFVRLCDRDLGQ